MWARLCSKGKWSAERVPAQARKLEGELDVKLASYAKLCSGFEASYRHRASDGAEQVCVFEMGHIC
jgi:hypothetical protein